MKRRHKKHELSEGYQIAKRIFFLLLVLFSSTATGTEQILDVLYLNGKTHTVSGLNLSKAMSNNLNLFLQNHSNEYDYCSANWDGYKATMSVKNNKLFITKLDIGCKFIEDPNYQTPDPKIVFGVSIPDSGLFAEWFSGSLIEYFGEQLSEDFIDSKSDVRIFNFENGILLKIEEQSNELY